MNFLRKETYDLKDSMTILQFPSVAGCVKYFKRRPIVRKIE